VVPGGIAAGIDWEAVYREHVGAVYRFVYSRVGNRADAEDVTATVFERALPRLQAGAATLQLRVYLYTTARTTIADFWRDRHGTTLLDEGRPVAVVGSDDESEDRDQEVERVLSVLPGNYREVLELRFLRGYSIKEAAQAMGTSAGNIKVLQLRALRRAAQEFAG